MDLTLSMVLEQDLRRSKLPKSKTVARINSIISGARDMYEHTLIISSKRTRLDGENIRIYSASVNGNSWHSEALTLEGAIQKLYEKWDFCADAIGKPKGVGND